MKSKRNNTQGEGRTLLLGLWLAKEKNTHYEGLTLLRGLNHDGQKKQHPGWGTDPSPGLKTWRAKETSPRMRDGPFSWAQNKRGKRNNTQDEGWTLLLGLKHDGQKKQHPGWGTDPSPGHKTREAKSLNVLSENFSIDGVHVCTVNGTSCTSLILAAFCRLYNLSRDQSPWS